VAWAFRFVATMVNKKELAKLIDSFLDGSAREWEWDDFISVKQVDPEIEQIRQKCIALPKEFPPTEPRTYCNIEGMNVLKSIAEKLLLRAKF